MLDHPTPLAQDVLWVASRRLWSLASSARPAAPPTNRESKQMTLYIPATYYEVAFTHTLQGSIHPAVCTLGLFYFGTDFDNDSNGADAAWLADIMPSMADVWACTEISWRVQAGTVKQVFPSTQGGTAHTATTPNVTFLLRKSTGVPGRKNRGRIYLPGVSEQDVDATGVVVGSKITEINTGLGALVGDLAAANFTPYLLHNITVADPTPAPTLISTITCEPLAATQRRRMRG
jgi:hypothetical protein